MDPLEIQKYNSLTKKVIFFSQIQERHFSNIKEILLESTHAMSMKNILTYKFSMIAFCPCTLPPLKRRETNIKCYWLTTGILKSKKIFKYKGRNKTNYSSPYTFRKFEISNCFTFLGVLAIKKLWFQWNIYYLTSNIIEVKYKSKCYGSVYYISFKPITLNKYPIASQRKLRSHADITCI